MNRRLRGDAKENIFVGVTNFSVWGLTLSKPSCVLVPDRETIHYNEHVQGINAERQLGCNYFYNAAIRPLT